MIQYDPIVITSSYIYTICKELCSVISLNSSSKKSRIISIPVLYEKEYAPDIEFVSTHTGLSINEAKNQAFNSLSSALEMAHKARKYKVA